MVVCPLVAESPISSHSLLLAVNDGQSPSSAGLHFLYWESRSSPSKAHRIHTQINGRASCGVNSINTSDTRVQQHGNKNTLSGGGAAGIHQPPSWVTLTDGPA